MASTGSTMKRPPALRRGPQIVVLLLIMGLLGAMLIQPTRQLLAQRQRIDEMAGHLTEVQGANEKLRSRIERLQDPDHIEQQAREQAGLVKPGETAVRIMTPSEQKLEAKEQAKQRRQAPPPPEPGVIERFLDFVGFL
jgi:cell division protein FtsB